jgi:hypothetical protein
MNDKKHHAYLHPDALFFFVRLVLRPVESTIGIGLFASLLFAIYAFCTLFPGVIFTNMMAHDNFVFIDGIHRIWSGHIPHLDFSTALGALNFLWPAIFGLITDSEFKAFLLQQISFLALILGLSVYISRTRLNYFCSIVLLIYMAAIVGAPVAIGFPGSFVTYALYYNRFGWALVVVSFLMFLPVNHLRTLKEGTWRFEACFEAFVLWIAFYTKITYFVSIFGLFLIFACIDRRWLKAFIASCLCFLIGMGCVELFWPGLHLAYFGDLLMAGKSTDAGFLLMALDDLKYNLAGLLGSIIAISIVFTTYRKFNVLGIRTFIAPAFYLVLISLFIAANNSDLYSLPSLFALYVTGFILVLNVTREIHEARKFQKFALISLGLLVFLSAVPEAIERQGALERFFRIGYFNKRYPYPFPYPASMGEMKIIEGKVGFLEKLDSEGKVTLTAEELRAHVIPPRQEIYQTQFAYMVAKGYQALLDVFSKWRPGPIIHLDFTNPFSTLLGTPSALGEYAWYHAGRNISKHVHLPPGRVFQDAKFVMVSRFPTVAATAALLEEIYGEYIKRNYTLVYKDAFWKIWMSNRVDNTRELKRQKNNNE